MGHLRYRPKNQKGYDGYTNEQREYQRRDEPVEWEDKCPGVLVQSITARYSDGTMMRAHGILTKD